MKDFNEFFLMGTEDVKAYTVEVLKFFDASETLTCEEIGDGNINYVFRVTSEKDGRSVIVKQADKLLRSSGRPLDIYRNKIEASILKLESELAPGMVPELYHYDEKMACTSMEDVSAYKNLRKELMANRVYDHLADQMSSFCVDTLLPTTDLVMDSAEKKKAVKYYTNPDLCFITEDLVLTEPYYYYWFERNKNIVFEGNEEFVDEFLYNDPDLHAEVAILREGFMNHAQALIHGDLHSGSIFANEDGIKVLDPEFAFYGPMGYDIGNIIGNLFFSLANKCFAQPESAENSIAIEKLYSCISDFHEMMYRKLEEKYDAIVTFPLYQNIAFRDHYIDSIMSDTLGYAGLEMIRRTVGDSKVMEVSSVTDPAKRIPMERALIKMGIWLIKNRECIAVGEELIEQFRLIIA